VYQQTRRWLAAGCFEALVEDLRAILRLAAGRSVEPSAAIIDSRTLRFSSESGEGAGYDGAKRKKGSKVHLAVDTLGHLLALHVTPASAGDRGEIETLAKTVQAVTDDSVEIAWVDQVYIGARAAEAAACRGIRLEVVKLPEATPELASGAVQRLLRDWSLPPIDLWAVFPTGRLASAKARAVAASIKHPLLQ
jgi:transposase